MPEWTMMNLDIQTAFPACWGFALRPHNTFSGQHGNQIQYQKQQLHLLVSQLIGLSCLGQIYWLIHPFVYQYTVCSWFHSWLHLDLYLRFPFMITSWLMVSWLPWFLFIDDLYLLTIIWWIWWFLKMNPKIILYIFSFFVINHPFSGFPIWRHPHIAKFSHQPIQWQGLPSSSWSNESGGVENPP